MRDQEQGRPSDSPCSLLHALLQLQDSLRQLQAERDQYVANLKEDSTVWQHKMQQMNEQVSRDLRPPPPFGPLIFCRLPRAAGGGSMCLEVKRARVTRSLLHPLPFLPCGLPPCLGS